MPYGEFKRRAPAKERARKKVIKKAITHRVAVTPKAAPKTSFGPVPQRVFEASEEKVVHRAGRHAVRKEATALFRKAKRKGLLHGKRRPKIVFDEGLPDNVLGTAPYKDKTIHLSPFVIGALTNDHPASVVRRKMRRDAQQVILHEMAHKEQKHYLRGDKTLEEGGARSFERYAVKRLRGTPTPETPNDPYYNYLVDARLMGPKWIRKGQFKKRKKKR